MAEIKPAHPAGHFYSPINDVNTLDRALLEKGRRATHPTEILDIDIDEQAMIALWQKFMSIADRFPFQTEEDPVYRYYLGNPFFGVGDAFVLFCMLSIHRPKHLIEIGSGFTSACVLDTLDHEKLDTRCTFIEPYASRLRKLLRPEDHSRCKILEVKVQATDLALYQSLDAGDILFIDSTHVLKAQSDVAFELFEILPRLKSGVLIHFHDMFWPFEYPAPWLLDKQYSWNELYAVRAFLMNNPRFKIEFFNDFFSWNHRNLIESAPRSHHLKPMKRHMGGSLWLRKL